MSAASDSRSNPSCEVLVGPQDYLRGPDGRSHSLAPLKSGLSDRGWISELVSGNEHLFTPDVVETSNKKVYRFQASSAGRFFCCVTGLGFVLESSGEVTYSFCSWEKAPKTPGKWRPAGPLFDIECPQRTLKELHLPHCEVSADGDLAVAHVTEENMEILQPLKVTDTHVVISVTGLSPFAVIKRSIFRRVRGQVLLLLRPIQNILNMFLLPRNVPPHQVWQQEQQRQNSYIPTSPMCTLISKEGYRISDCKDIRVIQPQEEKFKCIFDKPFYPTFELFLNDDVVEMELSVLEDSSSEEVWKRFITLKGAVHLSQSRTSEDNERQHGDSGASWIGKKKHAVTSLPHFDVIKRAIFPKVHGQVLLLLRPAEKALSVFLLPRNVLPEQVHEQEEQRQNIVIPTSSMCRLIHKRRYKISCDSKAIKRIQPEKWRFDCIVDQTIHSTFDLFLNDDVVEIELSVLEDRSDEVVWKRLITLKGAVPPSPSMTTTDSNSEAGVTFVDRHREAIIENVSLIGPILDELYQHIGDEKYNRIRAADTSQEKMRRLYEVLNCRDLKILFFDALNRKEPHLVSELKNS